MAASAVINRQSAVYLQNIDSRTNLIMSESSNKPMGISLFGYCFKFQSQHNKRTYHKALVLLLTFIAYAAFHMGRRPLSVAKNVLNRKCLPDYSSLNISPNFSHHDLNDLKQKPETTAFSLNESHDNSCSWPPFDVDETANQLLATLDSSFLLSYAIFMFFSGIVAERVNLRYFISLGSIISGLSLIAFGLAHRLGIHSMTYFLVVQVVSGVAQTTGWPVVVSCVGNWFGPRKRGLIYGIWNSHTSVGNIAGAIIAGVFVEYDWGMSFFAPGGIMIFVGFILFLFLVPSPYDVNLSCSSTEDLENAEKDARPQFAGVVPRYDSLEGRKRVRAENVLIMGVSPFDQQKAISFLDALKIPGVIEYSLCLFFSKLVSYTFLYWLPRYIAASTSMDSQTSAYLSTPFDVGGIAGGILAGYLSDKFQASGSTCIAMLVLAIPSLFAYQAIGSWSSVSNILLQLLVGALVNGPYCLITTAVSADLGSNIANSHAMATVAAIIDGMGSIGAVLGPLFAGFASKSDDWQSVFLMLMLADVFASLCLIRVTYHEMKRKHSKSDQSLMTYPANKS